MKRRDFLARSLGVAAGAVLWTPWEAGAAAGSSSDLSGWDNLTGQVVRAGDLDYDTACQCGNGRIAGSPAAIVFCRSAADVCQAVTWARRNGLAFRARCGRHSYEGYSTVDGGVVIDVSPIKNVRLDRERGTAWVGSGIGLLDLYAALWKDGMTVPGGSCPTVGIAGSTLGGGFGLLARRYGLTCDNLLAANVVTADGRLVHATEETNSDLLWACKGGGGGNFGIATAFQFRTHAVDTVAVYRIAWDWDDLEAAIDSWQAWAPHVDDRLTNVLSLRSKDEDEHSSTGLFLGSAAELSKLIAPLKSAGRPVEVTLHTMSYWDSVMRFAGLGETSYANWHLHEAPYRSPFKNTSDYADRPLTAEAIGVIRRQLADAPSRGSLVQLEGYGGAIGRVAPTATAFCHRAGVLFGLQYQSYWGYGAGTDEIAWVNAFRRDMQPYVSGMAYGNYVDSGIADWPQAYYGPNLPRLRQIKRKYDPENAFRFPQSIPPELP